MKKKWLLSAILAGAILLTGCSAEDTYNAADYYSAVNGGVSVGVATKIDEPQNTGDFSLTTEDGTFTQSGSVYTITSGGSYTASGVLSGQILISAGDDDEVELVLNGADITYGSDSPIKATTGSKLEVKAEAGTSNLVKDTRNVKKADDESQGEGAISADIDLKLKGTGTLVVSGAYNNGVHTTDDLTVQKLTLQVTAVNNALKGKDGVTVTSGTLNLYSSKGNGIKTENTDVSSKGNQRGTIEIDGGTVFIDVCCDGVDAAYNVVIDQTDSSINTALTVLTGKKSSYSANYSSVNSSKGIKAANEIYINAGDTVIQGTDDAVHANYGDSLSSGALGQGNIYIAGGTLGVAGGDDGIHADNTLTVSGGTNVITNAQEGIEANHIVISGGATYVYGSDDGVNASNKINETPTIVVSGGILDVAVSSGDTDGIDSNGTYAQTGGLVISRGSPGNFSSMSTGLDTDGKASITGGTFIAFNGIETTPSTGGSVKYAGVSYSAQTGGGMFGGRGGVNNNTRTSTSHTFASGSYTLSSSDGSFDVSFKNDYQYVVFLIYSANLNTGSTYTLSLSGTAVLSWTQTGSSVTIS